MSVPARRRSRHVAISTLLVPLCLADIAYGFGGLVIYNHNLRDITDRWRLGSNQLLVKVQYSFRY